jgi:hypothetical protein
VQLSRWWAVRARGRHARAAARVIHDDGEFKTICPWRENAELIIG